MRGGVSTTQRLKYKPSQNDRQKSGEELFNHTNGEIYSYKWQATKRHPNTK